jgi:phytoene dehydrogenase-like protein
MVNTKTSKPARGASGDFALVVGAGISGLLVSALLLAKGRKVHLTEKLPRPGGRLSPEKREGFTLGAGFAFGDSAWWRATADRLGMKSPTLPVTNGNALTHSTRGWHAPESLPQWESFLSEPCTEFPAGGAHGIMETLLAYCSAQENFSLSLECPATALLGDGKGGIGSVSLGPDHEILPKDIYWCADYKNLLEVLGGEGVPEPGPARVSWLKSFVKTSPQPGVVLEFAHKAKLGDFTETLLLPFNADKGEKHYLAGSIASNRDPSLAPEGQSLSTWVLPLTEAEWGDNHETMKKIRSARRLIEKTFPQLEQTVLFDRVLVLDTTVSPLGKRKGEWKPLMPNLHLTAEWAMPHGATLPSLADTLLQSL